MAALPQWAQRLGTWATPIDDQSELLGDITENYQWRINQGKKWQAKLQLIKDISILYYHFFVPKLYINMTPQLIRNFNKVYFRNFRKKPLQNGVSLLGLVIGILSLLVLAVIIKTETSYDQAFQDSDRIFRLHKKNWEASGDYSATTTSYLLKGVAMESLPEVESVTRVISNGSRSIQTTLSYPVDRPLGKFYSHYADNNFFEFFGLDFKWGNPDMALDEANEIVITEKLSQIAFGGENPVGKQMFMNGRPLTVSGVIANYPERSHIQFEYLISFSTLFDRRWNHNRLNQEWHYADFISNYFKLNDKNQAEEIASKVSGIQSELKKAEEEAIEYELMRLTDIYLNSDSELGENGDKKMVQVLSIVAIVLFVLMIVNYTNISVANSMKKVREMSIRKVHGSNISQLGGQLMFENLLTLSIAWLLAYLAALLLATGANTESFYPISVTDLLATDILFVSFVVVVIIGFFASIYPLFLCVKNINISSMKGNLIKGANGKRMLKTLISLQFLFSFALITCSLLFKSQIDFILSKDLGFDKDQMAYIERLDADTTIMSNQILAQLLENIPGVNKVTGTNQIPLHWSSGPNYELTIEGENSGVKMSRAWVRDGYFNTLGVEMFEGREFSENIQSDTAGIIINRTAMQAMGLENPIGQRVTIDFGYDRFESRTIIGVVNDFNYRSLHEPLLPSYFAYESGSSVIILNFEPAARKEVFEQSAVLYETNTPNQVFNFEFMDDALAWHHEKDIFLKNGLSLFSAIVIVLSALGLFGMSQFMATLRTKEISIHKVHGAQWFNVFWLLEKHFVATSLVAMLISTPISYFLFKEWLASFAYQTDISPITFAIGFVILFGIILLVSGLNTIKLIVTNPVKFLKDD